MYNDAPLFPSFQRQCLPYAKPLNYAPAPDKGCRKQNGECIPHGYQPKQNNPGELKFHYINYPFPNLHGDLKTHPGKGWHEYKTTGEYYVLW